jgi:HTH-type transcriptional regulator, glycine betaine synthesis regulator
MPMPLPAVEHQNRQPAGAAPVPGPLSEIEAEAIAIFVELARMVGQPKSFGQVYGMLFISARPISAAGMMDRLRISKAGAERAFQFLRQAGAVRIVHVPGDRRVHYEAVADLRHIIAGYVRHQILPQIELSQNRLQRLAEVLSKLPRDHQSKVNSRLSMLQSWGKKGRKFLPLVLKFLEL